MTRIWRIDMLKLMGAALPLFLASASFATGTLPRLLERPALTGTWEALWFWDTRPERPCIYRLRVPAKGAAYLVEVEAAAGDQDAIVRTFRMSEPTVSRGKVEFSGVADGRNKVFIEGTGKGDLEFGSILAKLEVRDIDGRLIY